MVEYRESNPRAVALVIPPRRPAAAAGCRWAETPPAAELAEGSRREAPQGCCRRPEKG